MDGYVRVGSRADFIEGEIESFELDGEDVAVVLWQGRFYAFGNACTHRGVPLSAGYINDDCEVVCLLHAAAYEMATGACVRGPTKGESVASYSVRLEGEDVLIGDRVHLAKQETNLGTRWFSAGAPPPRWAE